MACRVVLGSEGVRVSKPGIDVYNYGAENNLLINTSFRTGQIMAHGVINLDIDSDTNVATGSGDIGPFSEVPDLIWAILYNDAATRYPPAVWNSVNYTWSFAYMPTINVSRSGISIRMNVGNIQPLPSYLIYQILRKARV